MRARGYIFVVALLLVLTAPRAAGDPTRPCAPDAPCHLRMRTESTIITPKGEYLVPPGHFYDESTWKSLDTEIVRLQNQETSLQEQNRVLRKSLEGWRPGWLTVTTVFLAGVGLGVGGYYWYDRR